MTPEDERDRLSRGIPPQWASAWGEDEFGVFACFQVGGVEQRMRWIERGAFTMGSPAEEVGRWDDEGPLREVTLTQGFWLADTPCTQKLWVAVIGSKPRRYQSLHKPVVQVSWDEVQGFFERLNARVEGLEAGLPTEAQWEYASRAGTTTATYPGDLSDRNKDPVMDDIVWYARNTGIGTEDIALRRRPNPWGLYDMLGSAYEWCADAPRTYASWTEPDPGEPLGLSRVLPGGSWFAYVRDVRAPRRVWFGRRDVGLGFRLFRGQGLRPAQPSPEG